MAALEGEDIDCWRVERELQSMTREVMGDRWDSFMFGPNGQEEKVYLDKMMRLERLYSNGQITEIELELAKERFSLELADNMSEEEIAEELKWYREVVLELPPATDQAADD